jgi:hypothetical protein
MTEISCKKFWETAGESLPEYPEDPVLREHLRACSSCREEFEGLQLLMAELRTGFEGSHDHEFWNGLRSSVKRELDSGERGFSWLIDWWVGVAGTVAIALLVFLIPPGTDPGRYIQPEEYLSALPGYSDIWAEEEVYEDTDTLTEAEYLVGMTDWSSVLMDLYDSRT